MQQHQIRAAGVEPIGGQMHLVRAGKVDEADLIQRRRAVLAALLGNAPVVDGTDVQKHVFSVHRRQLRLP